MEIVIIVLLLASLFGVWLLSVRRKLETQEENIRNAMYQTLVQLSAEREALEGLAEFLGQTMDAETFRRMKHSLESAQTAGKVGLPEWVAEQQRELQRSRKACRFCRHRRLIRSTGKQQKAMNIWWRPVD